MKILVQISLKCLTMDPTAICPHALEGGFWNVFLFSTSFHWTFPIESIWVRDLNNSPVLDNSVALTRQVICWTNDGLVYWLYMHTWINQTIAFRWIVKASRFTVWGLLGMADPRGLNPSFLFSENGYGLKLPSQQTLSSYCHYTSKFSAVDDVVAVTPGPSTTNTSEIYVWLLKQ